MRFLFYVGCVCRGRCVVSAILAAALNLFAYSAPGLAVEGRFALLVGVGRYAPDVEATPLEGVPHDLVNARRIASAMGIDEQSIIQILDAQATKANVELRLAELTKRVKPGDRVFLFFSGHGTRYAAGADCIEGFLTYDGDTISAKELAAYTGPMSTRAEKVIVMIDACFAGGVMDRTRSIKPGAKLQAKFVMRGDAKACSIQGKNNLATRSLLTELGRLGVRNENFVQIAAADREEVSWDEPGKGGYATQAVARCLLGEAEDLNQSGAVSLDEVRVCAQRIVNESMAPHRAAGYLPSTLQISGNRNLIVAPAPAKPPPQAVPPLASIRPVEVIQGQGQQSVQVPSVLKPTPSVTAPSVPPVSPQAPALTTLASTGPIAPSAGPGQQSVVVPGALVPPAPIIPQQPPPIVSPVSPAQPFAVTTAPSAGPIAPPQVQGESLAAVPAIPIAPNSTPPSSTGPLVTLEDIYQQRDPRRRLELAVPDKPLRVSQRDPFRFSVRSSVPGYVYAILLGSDEKSFYLVFPNRIDSDNRIKANQRMELPRPGWQLTAGGPPGTNRLLVVVGESPRDPSLFVSAGEAGAGPFAYAVTDLDGRRRLVDFFVGRGVKGRSAAIGAALAEIKEIN